MSLAQRSFRSVSWTTTATFISLPVNLIQSIILARTLPIEYFGIFAGVTSIINLSSTVFELGLTNAFLHRSEETKDENLACSAFFTLRLIFETIWLVLLLLFGSVSFTDMDLYVFIIMVIASYLIKITLAPRILLVRRVEHRRLAIIDLTIGMSTAIISILIAVTTKSIWALLISSVASLVVSFAGLYIWKPFWKPRLIWDLTIFRYYIYFGSRNLINNLLDSSVDNLDNLWTKYFMGDLRLGYYSRAFKFAIYPRQILSAPVNSVIVGTYAELKYDRRRLSMAFFRTNAILIRAGFLMAGWLAVIAPYFIRLIIGARWLPMLPAFRLMLVFAMLDPIKVAISNVFVAKGVPGKITIIRFIQLGVLIISLFIFGFKYQITGVALSMDLMVIVGTLLSLFFVRTYVDVSFRKLFLVPLIALLIGIGISISISLTVDLPTSDSLMIAIGTVLFCGAFLAILFLFEGQDLISMVRKLMNSASIGQQLGLKGNSRNFIYKFIYPTDSLDSLKKSRQYSHRRLIQRFSVYFHRYIYPRIERYRDLNLDNISSRNLNKHALLSYIVHPFSIQPDDPRFFRHINIWHAQEVVRVLNRMGYLVDVIDYRDQKFHPLKKYDLFIGHGGVNFSEIASHMDLNVPKIYFATGSYWKYHNSQEEARFFDLEMRRGCTLKRDRLIRYNEEEALLMADGIIAIGNKHTRDTYSKYSKVRMIDGTSLNDDQFDWNSRDFEVSSSNFLFFASGGNVHKGLDLVLEAFVGLEQILWVAAPLEKVFSKIYSNELRKQQNIHYIGWTQPRSGSFYQLMKTCGFCILPSCSEGQSQSVIEAMNFGVVPIVSKMAGVDVDDFGFLIDPVTIAEIRKVVIEASCMNSQIIRNLSFKARQTVKNRYSEDKFSKNLAESLNNILQEWK